MDHLGSVLKSIRLVKKFHRTFSSSISNENEQIFIYNTLAKTKEPLKLRHNNALYWYSCGPTVYDSAHIGHASSYVNFDIIKRILSKYFRINVINLMNITDIDDKIIRKANQEGKHYSAIAKHYEREFFEDLRLLNCEQPAIVLRVTDYIPDIVCFIHKLIKNELAYVTRTGSVYFDTQKFTVKSFVKQIEPESELDSKENREKRHPHDFALWKARKEANEPAWPSQWGGQGRPGWHVECSTLATIAFGHSLDMHSGGKDLIFPHHQNEMLQCCAYHRLNTWSSSWMHTGHLHLKNDTKMSKSLSNTISIRDLLKKYSSDQFRMFCLLSPYRNDREFSDEQMLRAKSLLNSFSSFIKLCKSYSNKEIDVESLDLNESEISEKLSSARENVHKALMDDFNTCLVIEELTKLVAYMNQIFQKSKRSSDSAASSDLNRHYGCIMSVSNYVETLLELFGLNMKIELEGRADLSASSLKTSLLVDSALKFRSLVRNLALNKKLDLSKDVKHELLKYCDDFRDDLTQANVEFKDHKEKTIWQIKK